MKRDIDYLNSAWNANRPERGQFKVVKFARGSWGWTFTPEEPILNNLIGYQDGCETPEEAEGVLKQFVRGKLTR